LHGWIRLLGSKPQFGMGFYFYGCLFALLYDHCLTEDSDLNTKGRFDRAITAVLCYIEFFNFAIQYFVNLRRHPRTFAFGRVIEWTCMSRDWHLVAVTSLILNRFNAFTCN
jgi:hypothetical protein